MKCRKMNGENDANIKFDDRGNAIPYYGNTIISFTNDENTGIYQQALLAQNRLKESSFADCLAFLPPDSFHMTVLTLCREIDRGTSFWPRGVGQTETFSRIDAILKERAEQIKAPEGIMMQVEECQLTKLTLKPWRKEDAEKLKSYRDQVAEAVGIHHFWHDNFQFHISLDYHIRHLSEEQEKERQQICKELTRDLLSKAEPFRVEQPVFVIFNDMFCYERELKKRGNLY